MSDLKVFAICGSLRQHSKNKALLVYAKNHAPKGMRIDIADISELPFYNEDLAEKPASAQSLIEKATQADAFLFACPEYNYSLAPALKNAIDWLSREPNNQVLAGKAVAMLGSGGGMGTSRAQYHLRQVCVCLDMPVLTKPEVFCNSFGSAFNESAELVDEKIQGQIQNQLQAFAVFIKKNQR